MLIFSGILVGRTRVSLLAPQIMPERSNRLKKGKKSIEEIKIPFVSTS
jgi:hypothetical protein